MKNFHYQHLQPKSVLKSRKSDFDGYFDDCDDDEVPGLGLSEDSSQPNDSVESNVSILVFNISL